MSEQIEQGQEQEEAQDDTYATEAKEMGWRPKDEYEGDEEKWVDAKTFVERGEHIMPILRANNKRIKQDLLTREKEIATLKQSVESANKAIKALQKSYTESTKQQVEQATKDLREQLKQARVVGDVDAEFEIQDKLTDLRESSKEVQEEATSSTSDKGEGTQTLAPEFVAWNKENPWFGDNTTPENRKRTRELVRIGEDLRDDGDTTEGRAFMDKCMGILLKKEGRPAGKAPSKVENSAPGARQGSHSGRAFDRLTSEAKAICHDDNDNFVGPGKMFKTVKEWEDHFASYMSED